ncbi:MAG: SixA phosphatase family protein, partial [Pseudanabaena sp.]
MPSIYLIRHGIAEDRENYEDDTLRPHTNEGQRKTKHVAKRLYDLGLRFDLLQTSPLVRAQQTAEIFTNIFGSPMQQS